MEKIIYQCPNSCNKYSKSIEEIYQAGKKHKGQLVTCIEACEKQKDTKLVKAERDRT